MGTQTLTIKKCPRCEKKFVADKGFYKSCSNADGYEWYCKQCQKTLKVERYHRDKDYVLDNHLWTEVDGVEQCSRCKLVRRKIANYRMKDRWFIEFYVNKKWQSEPVKCIIIK